MVSDSGCLCLGKEDSYDEFLTWYKTKAEKLFSHRRLVLEDKES